MNKTQFVLCLLSCISACTGVSTVQVVRHADGRTVGHRSVIALHDPTSADVYANVLISNRVAHQKCVFGSVAVTRRALIRRRQCMQPSMSGHEGPAHHAPLLSGPDAGFQIVHGESLHDAVVRIYETQVRDRGWRVVDFRALMRLGRALCVQTARVAGMLCATGLPALTALCL